MGHRRVAATHASNRENEDGCERLWGLGMVNGLGIQGQKDLGPAVEREEPRRLVRVTEKRKMPMMLGFGNGLGIGRGAARAKDAQGTPTQSRISLSMLQYTKIKDSSTRYV